MNKFYILTILLFSIGCYSNEFEEEKSTEEDIPEVIIDHNLIGIIYSPQNQPTNVEITYDNKTVSVSDDDEFFYMEADKVEQSREILKVFHLGSTYHYSFPKIENDINYTTFVLPNETIENSNTMDINVGSLQLKVLENGSSTKIHYWKSEGKGIYPGGSLLQDSDGKLKMIVAKQYFQVESNGSPFKFEYSGNDLMIFDKNLSVWRPFKDNVVVINEPTLLATAKIKDYSLMRGSISTNGNKANGEYIRIGTQKIQTTKRGDFLLYTPLGEEVDIMLLNDCNQSGLKITPSETAVTIDSSVLSFSSQEYKTISGVLRDCNNNNANDGFIIIKASEGNIVKKIEESDFEISFPSCDSDPECKVIFMNEDGGLSTDFTITTFPFNLRDIHICDQFGDEYMLINVDGELLYFDNVWLNTINDEIVLEGYTAEATLQITLSELAQKSYPDQSINIVLNAENAGTTGYKINCGESKEGCGFEDLELILVGKDEGDKVHGVFKGNFWTQLFRPELKAGYREVSGVIHVRR